MMRRLLWTSLVVFLLLGWMDPTDGLAKNPRPRRPKNGNQQTTKDNVAIIRNHKRIKPLSQRPHSQALLVEHDILWPNKNNKGGSKSSSSTMIPTFSHVIGSDDVGGGSIAGPIVTASVCLLQPSLSSVIVTDNINQDNDNNSDNNIDSDSQGYTLPVVRDCKQQTPEQRQAIYEHVCQHQGTLYAWSYAVRSHTVVDEQGVHETCMDAFAESIQNVTQQLLLRASTSADMDTTATSTINNNNNNHAPMHQIYSIVDGKDSPAQLREDDNNNNNNNKMALTSRPWKKADETVYTVALASNVARVIRDRLMQELAQQYPQYQFDQNAGHATPTHLAALDQHGPSPVHRRQTQPIQSRGQFLASSVLALLSAVTTTTPRLRSEATTLDKKTGIVYPDVGEMEAAIPSDWSDIVEYPFGDKANFGRLDNTNDAVFYQDPRFVEHIDAAAVERLTRYVSGVAQSATDILDLCSSWTSHLDLAPLSTTSTNSKRRIAGLGMNAQELQANPQLTEWTVQDLNEKPVLPYADAAFDVVLLQLSIDYLTQPLRVCQEISRVLRPNGRVHILFSNRLFLSKAVALWTGADDIDHAYAVGCFLHFCGGGWVDIQAKDLSQRNPKTKQIVGDPLYVVTACKGAL